MDQFNTKQLQLLELLIMNDEYKPISYYADVLNVSSRSIHNYIAVINEFIKEKGLSVEPKQGTGILLECSTQEKMDLLNGINQTSNEMKALGTEERQLEIAKMLILNEETITHQKLSDYFYVSTTSISKDLEKISSGFDSSTAQLQSTRKGTRICGNESQYQNTLIKLLEYMYSISDSDLESFLSIYFSNSIIQAVFESLENIKTEVGIIIAEKYYDSVVTTIVVFLIRLMDGKHADLDRDFIFEEIRNLDTYFFAEDLLKQYSKQLDFSYRESDIDYLNKQLVAHGVKISYVNDEISYKYAEIVRKLISEMSEILDVELRDDYKLYEGLLVHFIPMIYRLKMNVRIKNPLLKEIKEQYSIAFSGTWYAMADIESMLNITLTDDEVSFIAVYFQVAVERNTNGKKILIVCPTGIGTSELIFNKVKKIIPAQDTLEISTVKQLETRDLKKVDLIITAVELKQISKPIIKVSSLLTNTDIKNISNLYTELFYTDEKEQKIDSNYEFINLHSIIDKEYIFSGIEFKNKDECLTHLIQCLEKKDIVDDDFKNYVFERERQGTTALSSGVALPHASPEHVKESKLVIAILKNKIEWYPEKIDIILLLCLSNKDKCNIKAILSDVYRLVSTNSRVKYYFEDKSVDQIYDLLSNS